MKTNNFRIMNPNREELIDSIKKSTEFLAKYNPPPPPQAQWVKEYQNEPVTQRAPEIWEELQRLNEKQKRDLTSAVIDSVRDYRKFKCSRCNREWFGNAYQLEGKTTCGSCVVDRWEEYHNEQ